MLKEDRLQYIVEKLKKEHRVLSTQLIQDLQVSDDTIRRDLNELEVSGQIRRVHGGAVLHSPIPLLYDSREHFQREKKISIAKKAISLLEDNQTILIDGGTTNMELIAHLPNDLRLTVLTNSIPIAYQLTEHKSIEVILIGGRLFKESKVTVDLEGLQLITNVHADWYFMGMAGITSQRGVSVPDWQEAQVKRAMLQVGSRIAILAISDKLGVLAPYTVCPTTEIHTLITDLDPKDELLADYRKLELHVL